VLERVALERDRRRPQRRRPIERDAPGNARQRALAAARARNDARALAGALNPLGQPLFSELNADGGSIMGYRAIPSQVAGTTVALVQPREVLYADDGGVTIDVSTEASVQMDSAPMNPADATVVMTSFFQNNLVGLRAERFINWKRARAGAVQYTVATYAAA